MFVDCTQTHTCTPMGLHARPGHLHTHVGVPEFMCVHRVPGHADWHGDTGCVCVLCVDGASLPHPPAQGLRPGGLPGSGAGGRLLVHGLGLIGRSFQVALKHSWLCPSSAPWFLGFLHSAAMI